MIPVLSQALQKSLQFLATKVCREYVRRMCDGDVGLIQKVEQAPEHLQNSGSDCK